MKNQDTVHLLQECSSGIQMAVSSIDGVLPSVNSQELRARLEDSLERHQVLSHEADALLAQYELDTKQPPATAKGMSWLKTNVMLTMKPKDSTVADLMVDGCNMGIKSLARYMNQYSSADVQSRDLARQLIGIEDQMANSMRPYL